VEEPRYLAGRYRLVERLGQGGMSVVWRAYDEVLGRLVAVKMLDPANAADAASRDRIRAEARAAARLSHPYITNVYDYGECTLGAGEPTPFVVMELVEGEPLDVRLDRERLAPEFAIEVCGQVAAALCAVHARGLVHRDVKPANVMLTPDGAKLVDFGISAVAGDSPDTVDRVMGTPAYLAPERLDGGPADAASDMYALGLLLYKALVGRLPWDADTTTQMLVAHCYLDPEPLPRVPGLPAVVVDLVHRCLAKEPADRPNAAVAVHVLGAGATARLPVVDPVAAAPILGRAEVGTEATTSRAFTGSTGSTGGVLSIGRWVRTGATSAASGAAARASRALATVGIPGAARHRLATAFSAATSDPATSGAGNGKRGDSAPAGRRLSPLAHGRLLRPGLALAALLAAAATALSWIGSDGTTPPAAAEAAAPSGSAAPGGNAGRVAMPDRGCQVQYATRSDVAGQFVVDLTVRNTGTEAVPAWDLAFAYPGDQRVRELAGAEYRQDGTEVHLRGGELPAGGTTTVTLSGTYGSANPLPTAFALGGRACGSRLVGVANSPTPPAVAPAGQQQQQPPAAVPPAGKPGEKAPKPPKPKDDDDDDD
jgi:hypothetical protein